MTRQLSAKQTPAPPPPSSVVCDAHNATNLPDVLPSPPNHTAAQLEPQVQTESEDSDHAHTNSTAEADPPSAPTSNSHHAPENDIPIDTADGQEDNIPSSPNNDGPPSSPPQTAADVQDLLKNLDVPEKIGPELLEEVRKSTGLSFEKSKIAVETVLGYVGFKVPALEGLMDRMLTSLHFGVGPCLHFMVGPCSVHFGVGLCTVLFGVNPGLHLGMGLCSLHFGVDLCSVHFGVGLCSVHFGVGLCSVHFGVGLCSVHFGPGPCRSMVICVLYDVRTSCDHPFYYSSMIYWMRRGQVVVIHFTVAA